MRKISIFFILLLCTTSVAAQTIGELAERITVGADIVTRFLWVVCLVMGVALIILAATLYQGHRHNPKLVPLSKPVMYLCLGFCVIMIPFLELYFGETGHSLINKVRPGPTVIHDSDAPLEGYDFGH